ncbi:MAG: hypothetical protein DMF13_02005 [Verrucomicrobia bacterium]|nr:MAG: hypothetical protein DMF13_02005 [Verrucomicrobiota bacterium]
MIRAIRSISQGGEAATKNFSVVFARSLLQTDLAQRRIFPGSARASPKCPSWFKQRKSLARRQRQHARARALPRRESQPQKLRDNESAQAPPTNILQKPRILRRKTINQAKLQKLLIYTHNLALLIDCFKQSISWLLSG